MRRRRILGTVPAAAASIALPDAGRAQTSTVRRTGVLSVAPADSGFGRLVRAGLAEALRAEGYEEGRNLAVDWRFGDGRVDELPVMAAELVRGRPEVIVAVLNYEIAAAIRAASAIPIVMFLASLPVELGFVASLARPGGNVTGTTYTDPEMAGKLLQLVKELQPSARRVANLINNAYPGMRAYRAHFERAARALELQVIDVEAGRAEDVGPALARAAAVRPDVLFFAQDPVLASRIPEIVAAAREHRWPTMGSALQFVVEGGLMAYAPEGAHLVRRAASQVARILAGQRAAEIPVELPSIYRLMVNLRTAREIGFAVPRSLVARADQVIE